jgi:hypothetical protein
MRQENKGPWYLITGLVIGLVAGMLFGWMVQPVQYTNTKPASLRSDFKDQYRALIASAYLADGNLVRAKARLELLGDPDMYRTLAEQAQRTLADGSFPQEARALGVLAVALGQAPATANVTPAAPGITPSAGTASLPLPTASAAISGTLSLKPTSASTQSASPTAGPTRTPRPTSTPMPTFTPLPSLTPTATQGAPYILDSQQAVCDITIPGPLLMVTALNAARQEVPGVEVVASWDGGEDHFYTGLKPELGLGYTDFSMTPGVVYSVRLAGGGPPIQNLTASECENSGGGRYWGSWKLVFIQP